MHERPSFSIGAAYRSAADQLDADELLAHSAANAGRSEATIDVPNRTEQLLAAVDLMLPAAHDRAKSQRWNSELASVLRIIAPDKALPALLAFVDEFDTLRRAGLMHAQNMRTCSAQMLTERSFEALMAAYLACHKDILAARAPSRLLVFRWHKANTQSFGLGNWIVFWTSALLASILTQRALLIDFESQPWRFDEYFTSPLELDWARHSAQFSHLASEIIVDECDLVLSDRVPLVIFEPIAGRSFVEIVGNRSETVRHSHSCISVLQLAWHDLFPLWHMFPSRSVLHVVGALAKALLLPSQNVQAEMDRHIAVFEQASQVVLVSIRHSGPRIILESDLQRVEQFAVCAKQLSVDGDSTIFYVTSDTESTRQILRKQLGANAYVINQRVAHFGADYNDGTVDELMSSRRLSVVEWFLMQRVDDAVLTSSSTFALTAFATTFKSPVSIDLGSANCGACTRASWDFRVTEFGLAKPCQAEISDSSHLQRFNMSTDGRELNTPIWQGPAPSETPGTHEA
jgi:hypothetical protein